MVVEHGGLGGRWRSAPAVRLISWHLATDRTGSRVTSRLLESRASRVRERAPYDDGVVMQPIARTVRVLHHRCALGQPPWPRAQRRARRNHDVAQWRI